MLKAVYYTTSPCAMPLLLSLFLPPSPFFIAVVCIETNTCVEGKQNSKCIMFYEISHLILEVKLLLRELYRYFTGPCPKVTLLCYEFLPKVFQVYRSLRQTCIQGKLAPGQDPGPDKLDMVIISLFCFQWECQICDPVLFSAKHLYWSPLGVLTGEIISHLYFFPVFNIYQGLQ